MPVQNGNRMKGRGGLSSTVGKTSLFVKEIFDKYGQGEKYRFDPVSLVYLLSNVPREEDKPEAPEEERAREYVLREKEILKLITHRERSREFFTRIVERIILPGSRELLYRKSRKEQLKNRIRAALQEGWEFVLGREGLEREKFQRDKLQREKLQGDKLQREGITEEGIAVIPRSEEELQAMRQFREELTVLEQSLEQWEEADLLQENQYQEQAVKSVVRLFRQRRMVEQQEKYWLLCRIRQICMQQLQADLADEKSAEKEVGKESGRESGKKVGKETEKKAVITEGQRLLHYIVERSDKVLQQWDRLEDLGSVSLQRNEEPVFEPGTKPEEIKQIRLLSLLLRETDLGILIGRLKPSEWEDISGKGWQEMSQEKFLEIQWRLVRRMIPEEMSQTRERLIERQFLDREAFVFYDGVWKYLEKANVDVSAEIFCTEYSVQTENRFIKNNPFGREVQLGGESRYGSEVILEGEGQLEGESQLKGKDQLEGKGQLEGDSRFGNEGQFGREGRFGNESQFGRKGRFGKEDQFGREGQLGWEKYPADIWHDIGSPAGIRQIFREVEWGRTFQEKTEQILKQQEVPYVGNRTMVQQKRPDVGDRTMVRQKRPDVGDRTMVRQEISDIGEQAMVRQEISDAGNRTMVQQEVSDAGNQTIVQQAHILYVLLRESNVALLAGRLFGRRWQEVPDFSGEWSLFRLFELQWQLAGQMYPAELEQVQKRLDEKGILEELSLSGPESMVFLSRIKEQIRNAKGFEESVEGIGKNTAALTENREVSVKDTKGFERNPEYSEKDAVVFKENQENNGRNTVDFEENSEGLVRISEEFEENREGFERNTEGYEENREGFEKDTEGFEKNREVYRKDIEDFEKNTESSGTLEYYPEELTADGYGLVWFLYERAERQTLWEPEGETDRDIIIDQKNIREMVYTYLLRELGMETLAGRVAQTEWGHFLEGIRELSLQDQLLQAEQFLILRMHPEEMDRSFERVLQEETYFTQVQHTEVRNVLEQIREQKVMQYLDSAFYRLLTMEPRDEDRKDRIPMGGDRKDYVDIKDKVWPDVDRKDRTGPDVDRKDGLRPDVDREDRTMPGGHMEDGVQPDENDVGELWPEILQVVGITTLVGRMERQEWEQLRSLLEQWNRLSEESQPLELLLVNHLKTAELEEVKRLRWEKQKRYGQERRLRLRPLQSDAKPNVGKLIRGLQSVRILKQLSLLTSADPGSEGHDIQENLDIQEMVQGVQLILNDSQTALIQQELRYLLRHVRQRRSRQSEQSGSGKNSQRTVTLQSVETVQREGFARENAVLTETALREPDTKHMEAEYGQSDSAWPEYAEAEYRQSGRAGTGYMQPEYDADHNRPGYVESAGQADPARTESGKAEYIWAEYNQMEPIYSEHTVLTDKSSDRSDTGYAQAEFRQTDFAQTKQVSPVHEQPDRAGTGRGMEYRYPDSAQAEYMQEEYNQFGSTRIEHGYAESGEGFSADDYTSLLTFLTGREDSTWEEDAGIQLQEEGDITLPTKFATYTYKGPTAAIQRQVIKARGEFSTAGNGSIKSPEETVMAAMAGETFSIEDAWMRDRERNLQIIPESGTMAWRMEDAPGSGAVARRMEDAPGSGAVAWRMEDAPRPGAMARRMEETPELGVMARRMEELLSASREPVPEEVGRTLEAQVSRALETVRNMPSGNGGRLDRRLIGLEETGGSSDRLRFHQAYSQRLHKQQARQQEQLEQLQEQSVRQEEQIRWMEGQQKKLEEQLAEPKDDPEELERRVIQKLEEQLRLERMRRGLA